MKYFIKARKTAALLLLFTLVSMIAVAIQVGPVEASPGDRTYDAEGSKSGFIAKEGASYPPTRFLGVWPGSGEQVGQKKWEPNIFDQYRGYLSFDTSGIPEGVEIVSATLYLALQYDYSSTDFDVEVYSGQDRWATLGPNDWGECTYPEGAFFNTNGKAVDTYYSKAITPSSISLTGRTQFRLISSREGAAPKGDEYVIFYRYNDFNFKPKLEVTWTIPPPTRYVRPGGLDDPARDGTVNDDDHAWKTIQYAIGRVEPGYRIIVSPGTYDEQVVIDKSLTLQGFGDTTIVKPSSYTKLTTVLDGYFSGGTKQIAGIIVADVPSGASVTVKNLKVDESSVTTKPEGAHYLTGIFYRETGGTIDTVNIVGTGVWSGSDRAYGIYLSAVENTVSVEVKGCTITNYDKNAIDAHGNKLTANIHHNTITGRGPLPSGDEVQNGVLVMDGATGTVNHNTISNMAYAPQTYWSAGVMFYDSGGSADSNTITDCQIGGIYQDGSGTATGNTVTGGTVGLIGLWAQYTKAGTWTVSFVDNVVSGARDSPGYENAAVGAQSWDAGASIAVTIDGNQLTGGGSTDADGIYIGDIPSYGPAGSIKVTIKDNTISGWYHGIHLVSSVASGSTITGNTIQNNVGTDSGIHIEAAVIATNIHVNFNNIEDNGPYGVFNVGTGTLDAENNWWGNATGPHHSTNPEATGNEVGNNVDYTPWLDGPYPGGNSRSYNVKNNNISPGTYNSIQAAITAASSGHTLLVYSGNYKCDLTVIGKANVILKSVSGASSTTITGTGSGPVVSIQGVSNNFKLGGSGFTIKGGASSTFLVEITSTQTGVTIQDNTFDSTGSTSRCISIGSEGATDLLVQGNVFTMDAGDVGVDCWGPITRLTVSDNAFTGPDSGNAGSVTFTPDSSVTTATISGNTITKATSQIQLKDGKTYDGITYQGNTFTQTAGAIRVWKPAPGVAVLRNLRITGNTFGTSTLDSYAFLILDSVEAADVDYTTVSVNYNSILPGSAGTTYGSVKNLASGEPSDLDAENNWWGATSGPTLSQVQTGAKVDYRPWINASVTDAASKKTVTGSDTFDATGPADTYVTKAGTGTPIITCVLYSGNPQAALSNGIGKYYDISIDSDSGVTSLTIKFYYTDADIAGFVESQLKMYYWDKTTHTWKLCSPQTLHTGAVDGYSGYIEVTVSTTTDPSLNYLATDAPFGPVATPLPRYYLKIKALNNAGSRVLSGATVYVKNSTKTSSGTVDANGWFNVTGISDASVTWWVKWRGTTVKYVPSQTMGQNREVLAKCQVTDVTFTAKDHAGNTLPSSGCQWNVVLPNSTHRTYNGNPVTVNDLVNGTYRIGIKWQGTYVISNQTWLKTIETAYSIDCSEVVDRTFIAVDSHETQLLSGATRIWIKTPGGTSWQTSTTNSSKFTLTKVGNGTYTIKVMYEGSKVSGEKSYPLDNRPAHLNFSIPCSVYDYTPILKDKNGVGYSGADIALLCPNGTTRHWITGSNGRVTIPKLQNGSYQITSVIYQGHKVNQTAAFLIGSDLTDWPIQFNGLSVSQAVCPDLAHLNSTFTIKVQLVYDYTGAAVPSGSIVGLLGASELNATTDASGWATFTLSEWQPVGPFTAFGIKDSKYGLTYLMQNKSISVAWAGDFNVQAVDAEGKALNNANLLIYNGTNTYWKTLNTDSTGFIHVKDAPCQSYTVDVEWKGVDVGSTTIDLDRAVVSKTVSCSVYYWDIRICDLSGTGIPNIEVKILDPSRAVYGTYKTNQAGYIPQIQQIPGQKYTVTLTYAGAFFGVTFNLNQNLETEFSIALAPCPDVPETGKICYATTSTVLSITYDEVFKQLKIDVTGTSGTTGTISIFIPNTLLENLGLTIENVHAFIGGEPVSYNVDACPDGYLLTISYTHSSHVIELVFSDITLITTVKDSNRRVIKSANVKLYREGALVEEGYTDNAGQATFNNLASGEYEVKTFHLGVLVKTGQVTLTEHYDYSIRCPVYDLIVQVFDMIPSPLPGTSVTASLPDGTVLFSGTTDGAGNVTFFQAPASEYKIRATYLFGSGSADITLDQNLTLQIYVPTLNMTTIVLLLTAVGTVAALVGAYLSKRGEEMPKRGRGRPRKVRMPT